MPCTRKIDGDGPLLSTAIPYWNQSSSITRTSRDAVVSIDEVLRKRQDVKPIGQSSVHIASQRNAPLEVLSLLVRSSNTILRQADDDGNLPVMVAIKHGSDPSAIEFLVNSDAETLFFRNVVGTTPLFMAVEYACSTVISVRNGCSRFLHRRGHPDQLSYDDNAIRVVSFLVNMAPHVMRVPEFLNGSTPLHALAAHNGPGRLETLRTIIESMKSATAWKKRYKAKPVRFVDVVSNQRRKDKMTPLHLACVVDHLSFELVPTLSLADPSSVASLDSEGRTPLHLLCNPCSTGSYIQQMLVDRQEALVCLIQGLCRTCPQALRIKDKSGKLPLHLYLECHLLPLKRPEVLMTMLELYPESAWVPSPTMGSVSHLVTSRALLSSQTMELHLDYETRGKIKSDAEDEKKEEAAERIVDPHLLCLFVLFNHWHLHGQSPEQGKSVAEDALAALEIFLARTPIAALQERVCGNSLRCVVRLIIYALFQVEYREALVSHGDYPPENVFMTNLVPELVATTTSKDLISLSERVKFLIRNDGSLVTMSILLPSLDSRIFFTMFPTWTPEWFAGCLRICPVFLSFGFVKWCVAHDVPSTFNLPLAAEALQLPTRETLLPNAKRTLAFFKDNHSFFDASLVQAVGAFAQMVIDGDGEPEEDSTEQHAPEA